MPDRTREQQLTAELRLARQHAHTVDAERADLEAELLRTRAEVQEARAHAARTQASVATKTSALHHLEDIWCRWYLDAHVGTTQRDFILGVGSDIQTVIEESKADGPAGPGDAAWGSVWLHGNWKWLTQNMTTSERELAADAVARWSAALNDEDPYIGEPDGLRWWQEASR